MRNDFKAAADANNMPFSYGTKAFLNLIANINADKTYLHLDPPKITPIRSGTGVTTGNQANGKFMLLVKGTLDAKYDVEQNAEGVTQKTKYQDSIEPLIPLMESVIASLENCGQDWEVTYSYTEFINLTDEVLDGILVTFQAKSF